MTACGRSGAVVIVEKVTLMVARKTPAASAAGSLAGFCPWAADEPVRVYLRPVGLLPHAAWAGGAAVPLAGTRFSFNTGELIVRKPGGRAERTFAPLAEIMAWGWERGREVATAVDGQLGRLTRSRPAFAGLDLKRPLIMGIINVTPDSFSDGGDHALPEQAIAVGEAMVRAGADMLDVGGESTRPGALPVSPEEELARVLPLVRHFAAAGVPVSVDTRNAPVMQAVMAAGARIINDINGLRDDGALDTVVASRAPAVIMHMQGDPRTMQNNPVYDDAALDVYDWLEQRISECVAAGMALEDICIDTGIGFGKTVDHNLDVLRHTAMYHGLGCPLLIGVSRKSFIGRLSRSEIPKERLAGSLAAGLECWNQGAHILRVHDVVETVQARAIWEGLHLSA